MHIFEKILSQDIFRKEPLVLVDIGASGELYPKWQKIRKHSVCISFDADDRDFEVCQSQDDTFLTHHKVNRLVSDTEGNKCFYLTEFPHCSSMLEPDEEELKKFYFSPFFKVRKSIVLKATTLPKVLNELGIQRIDWYKSDSQGVDLRIFQSLDQDMQSQITIAEFEPGIMDAYRGEDKLYDIMKSARSSKFMVLDMQVKGSHLIGEKMKNQMNFLKLFRPNMFFETIPGWAEVAFFNKLKVDNALTSERDVYVAWMFATIMKKHALAQMIVCESECRSPLIEEMRIYSENRIRFGYLKFFFVLPVNFLKRFL